MSLQAPEAMPAAFARAWADRDAAALAALFAPDADFVNVVGLWWRRREEIERAHAYGLSTFFADTTLRFGRTALRRLGEEVAVVHARAILDGQRAPDGTPAGRRRSVMVFVMHRRPSGWICVAAQNTDIVPGAETNLALDGGLSPADYRPAR